MKFACIVFVFFLNSLPGIYTAIAILHPVTFKVVIQNSRILSEIGSFSLLAVCSIKIKTMHWHSTLVGIWSSRMDHINVISNALLSLSSPSSWRTLEVTQTQAFNRSLLPTTAVPAIALTLRSDVIENWWNRSVWWLPGSATQIQLLCPVLKRDFRYASSSTDFKCVRNLDMLSFKPLN